MSLRIFLDKNGFHSLKKAIPQGSPSKAVLNGAVHLSFFGTNVVITCTEAEAQNLLLYANDSPAVAAAIRKALRPRVH